MADLLNLLFWGTAFYCVYRAFSWFLSPYFVYRNRRHDGELELIIAGKTVKLPTTPYLLQNPEAKDNDMRIASSELCGLGLVVPCYNEEKRLPSMLD